jgi:hypothetical protein
MRKCRDSIEDGISELIRLMIRKIARQGIKLLKMDYCFKI